MLCTFPDALLHDLAGNAFSATTCMNPLAAMLLLVGHAANMQRSITIPATPTPMVVDSDYGDDGDLTRTDADMAGADIFQGIPVPSSWAGA